MLWTVRRLSQTTESDGMETVVEQPMAPPRKKMKIDKKDKKGKAPGVRDAIKAIQDVPEKKGKHKNEKSKESSDSESMKIDATPMPKKKIRRVPEDDLPAGQYPRKAEGGRGEMRRRAVRARRRRHGRNIVQRVLHSRRGPADASDG